MDVPRSPSPQPMVRIASHEGPIDLRHPTPDLQSLQGAYIGNVERLEERAERMSSTGSELGEEIRKLQLEQKLSDSRKSSLLSGGDDCRGLPAARSRNASTSSYTNSIVDVNTTARWGGYSPGGFITSPIGSIRSGSWSQPSLQRQRSASRTSRLGRIIHPEDDDGHHELTVSPTMQNAVPRIASPKPSSRRESSFGQRYDQIAQEITNAFEDNASMLDGQHQRGQEDAYFLNPHDLPDRPPTAASTDTYQQARTLFQDFDGVHCSPVTEEGGASLQGSGSRNSSLLRSMPAPPQQAPPPPNDGMVFYPAPVPRMLNLPKRLSQLPAASVQAKRRTQLLQSLPPDARKSAVWLPDEVRNSAEFADPLQNRKSINPRKSVSGLPAQLRASMYFDKVVEAQEFEVKGESAEETLDSILEASAHAPVSAFTDHPFAGRVGNEVYGKEETRRSTASLLNLDKADARKSRSSLNLLRTRRNSSGDGLNKLQKRNSTQDLNRLTIRNSSHMSVATGPLNDIDPSHHHQEEDEDGAGEQTPLRQSLNDEREHSPEDVGEGEEGEEVSPEGPPGPQYHGPPTTLLAELQMRKQLQKNRNKTNTNFSVGLHSTLLELDAVAQLEKKKRHNAKVTLAWEDPDARPADEEDEDDDVPLGMLFPNRDGLINKSRDKPMASDWDRPLGLIAQRELEDNEPLSRRRNRLRGVDPRREPSPVKRLGTSQHSPSMPILPGQATTPPVEDDGEEETLAQRRRRLADRQTLDNAIGNVQTRPISGEFANEMLSQFGGLNDGEKETPGAAPVDEEEETLGQRRARLRAEALARGENPDAAANPLSSRPPLRASHSMADLLSAHPLGPHSARKVSNEMLLSSLPQGSLLQQSEIKRTRQKADLMETNKRSTSYGLDKPLVGDLGNIQDPSLVPKPGAFKGGMYNNGMGGLGGPVSSPQPGMPNAQPGSYYPMANMGMPTSMSMNFAQPGYFPQPGMMPQQMMGMNMGMQAPMPGYQAGFGYPQMSMQQMPQMSMQQMPQMSMQQMQQMSVAMQQPYDPMMDPRQRDMIDRWRQSIMP